MTAPTADPNLRIERAVTVQQVLSARSLFDAEPEPAVTQRFLASAGHHLLIAYDRAETPVGFVSGVEMTHPDKGTEMFLYELGVGEQARRRAVGATLVSALSDLARSRGCYAMWVVTETDNVAAKATYRKVGPQDGEVVELYSWDLTPEDDR
ncbi:MAG: GNAT family N-acetyltransferase [Actinomycetota bacterium]|nr:GNAT family N-acetyltransferase [Actinomycetota bacterium]